MNILLITVITLIVFLSLKTVLFTLLGKVCIVFHKKNHKKENKFSMKDSLLLYMLFELTWILTAWGIAQKVELTLIEYYVIFVLMGITSVIWSYFSWDAEYLVTPIMFSVKHEQYIKKVFLYTLLLFFTLGYGYIQVSNVITVGESINPVLAVVNSSIFIATIAFDRVLNQICLIITKSM